MKNKVDKDTATMTVGEVAVLIEDLRSQFRVFGDGLKTIDRKIEGIETTTARMWEKVAKIDLRLIRVEKKAEEIDIRLIRVEKKAEEIDIRLTRVEKKVEEIDSRLIRVEKDVAEIKESVKDHTNRIAHLETLVK